MKIRGRRHRQADPATLKGKKVTVVGASTARAGRRSPSRSSSSPCRIEVRRDDRGNPGRDHHGDRRGRGRPAAVDISKTYGVTHALKGVNFDIHRGKVTTLFGENGAGKSTLMKILSGVETPTSGRDRSSTASRSSFASHHRCARPRHLDHPPGAQPRRRTSASATTSSWAARSARRRRRRLRRGGAPDRAALMARARGGHRPADPGRGPPARPAADRRDRPRAVGRLPHPDHGRADLGAERGRGRGAVQGDPRPDRPAASRSSTSRTTSRRRCRSPTTPSCCATAPWPPPRTRADIDLEWIVRNMVGGNSELGFAAEPATRTARSRCRSRTSRVPTPPAAAGSAVDDLSLDVRAGEIVCIYGLMGAGRTEMMEALAGRGRIAGGRVLLGGEDVAGTDDRRADRAGRRCWCPRTASATASCRR